MSGIQHVFRRLSVYWWRRRLRIGTASCAYLRIEVSLCTKDQAVARSIAPYLTLKSAELVQQIRDGLMTPEEAKRVFMHLVRQETARIDHLRLHAPINPSSPEERRHGNQTLSAALRLVAAQGAHANVGPVEYRQLVAEGFDEESIDRIGGLLRLQKKLQLSTVSDDQAREILSAAGVADATTSRQQVQAIFLRARAAVIENQSNRWIELAKDDADLLREALNSEARVSSADEPVARQSSPPLAEAPSVSANLPGRPDFLPKRVTPEPATTSEGNQRQEPNKTARSVPEPEARPSRQRISDLVSIVQAEAEIFVAKKEWNTKTAGQHIALARLMVKFLGHDDPTRITQVDIADFRRAVVKLPKSHGKSPKDHLMSFDAILEKAKTLPADKVGLVPATMNRYMTQISNIENICKHAGYPFEDYQGVAGLRFTKKGDKRKERPPFTTSEVSRILELPIWSGCLSENRRLEGGDSVFHDASYWIPLLALYTAARREEYCGLMISDINTNAELPTIQFMHSRVRELKNFQSEREIPIHPELIRLGFLDYVNALREAGHTLLFPELVAASDKTPMGDVFDEDWQQIRAAALPDAKSEGKTLHSFRHWFNNELKQAGVPSEIRRDILGHLNKDVNEGRYTEPATPDLMLQAMSKLPIPNAKLQGFPIRLITHVIEHRQRKARKRVRPTQASAGA